MMRIAFVTVLGSALLAAGQDEVAGSDTAPLNVKVDVGVGVHVAASGIVADQGGLARGSGTENPAGNEQRAIFEKWGELLGNWKTLEGHLMHLFKAEQMEEEWYQNLQGFSSLKKEMDQASNALGAVLVDHSIATEDAEGVHAALEALSELIKATNVYVPGMLQLQHALLNHGDPDKIEAAQAKLIADDLAVAEKYGGDLLGQVSKSQHLKDELMKLFTVCAKIKKLLDQGLDIVKEEKEWVQEGAKSKVDLGGTDDSDFEHLKTWVSNTIEEEEALKNDLQRSVSSQEGAAGGNGASAAASAASLLQPSFEASAEASGRRIEATFPRATSHAAAFGAGKSGQQRGGKSGQL